MIRHYEKKLAFSVLSIAEDLRLIAGGRIGSPRIRQGEGQEAMKWTMSYTTFRFLVWLGYAAVVFVLITLTHRLETRQMTETLVALEERSLLPTCHNSVRREQDRGGIEEISKLACV